MIIYDLYILSKGDNLFVTHIPISDNIIPQYILFSDTCNDKTYLSRPIDSQIPDAQEVLEAEEGPDVTSVPEDVDVEEVPEL